MTERLLRATVPEALAGERLDQALAVLFPRFSRARLQRWIREGLVNVDARAWRPRDRVAGGEHVELRARLDADPGLEAEAIPLDVVHEDRDVLVVDKPAGLVVHPGAGNRSGTLVNALLAHDPDLAAVPRAGLIHRLDKDTSGLLVVARNLEAHRALVEALRLREIRREYTALVWGRVRAAGSIDQPIGRHPAQRTRMAVVAGGRPARTRYRIARRFAELTLLDVALDTGRTHQIRVHLAHLGHPIAGDPLYGGRRPPGSLPAPAAAALRALGRQALHACRLGFVHPTTGASMHLEAPLPRDFAALVAALDEISAASCG